MFVPVTYKDNADDEQLEVTEQQFFSQTLDCQILAETWETLVRDPPPWYAPEAQLQDWSLTERMQELEARPDVRLAVMLEGVSAELPPKTTRAMPPAFQADFLDQIRGNEERSAAQQVTHFRYSTLILHTDRELRVQQLLARFDWDDNSEATNHLLSALLTSALRKDRKYQQDGSDKTHSAPITAHDLLSELNPLDYITHVSREELAEIMRLRLEHEAEDKFYPAEKELNLVTVEGLCKQLPTACLRPVVELIFEKLGYPKQEDLSGTGPETTAPTGDEQGAETGPDSEIPEYRLDEVDDSEAPAPTDDAPGDSPKA